MGEEEDGVGIVTRDEGACEPIPLSLFSKGAASEFRMYFWLMRKLRFDSSWETTWARRASVCEFWDITVMNVGYSDKGNKDKDENNVVQGEPLSSAERLPLGHP